MVPLTSVRAAKFAVFAAVVQASVLEQKRDESSVRVSSRQAAFQFEGTSKGCYSSPPSGLQPAGSYTWQTSGYCGNKCTELGLPVMALQDFKCLCGERLPPTSSAAPDSSCSITCPGYDEEPCGGSDAYTVWLTGVPGNFAPIGDSNNPSPSQSPPSSTSIHTSTHHSQSKVPSTSTKSTTHQPTHTTSRKTVTETKNQSTVFKTVHGSPTTSPKSQSDSSPGTSSGSSSSNSTTIAIVVGVVAGIVVFAALIVLLLFYLRRRRRMKNAENGHRRADSLNAFVAAGGHMPGSMADRFPATNSSDNRLDPGIMRETRRESVGSFLADNQDYSRRILKVTNPDGT